MYDDLVRQQNNMAHAYVLSGNTQTNKTELEQFIVKDLGIETASNPNYFDRSYERLGIDQVRDLDELQSKTAVGEGNKIFVLTINSATVEAQNAMLKMIEEPTSGTIWFFLVPDQHMLLETIISRVQLLDGDQNTDYVQLAQEFMAATYLEREKIWNQFAGDSKKSIAPLRSEAAQFLGELMSFVLKNKTENFTEIYREIENMQNYMTDRSSSVKYIFEYLSIRIPASAPSAGSE